MSRSLVTRTILVDDSDWKSLSDVNSGEKNERRVETSVIIVLRTSVANSAEEWG